MFGGIGWPEFMILLIAALVILGPERLPGAMQWTMNAVRQARDYVSGTAEQLRSEIGPEVDQFREPLAQLRELRGMSPRDITTKYLLDGDDSILTGEFGPAPGTAEPVAESAAESAVTAPPETVTFRETIPPANCGTITPSEPVDPANCGVVDSAGWADIQPTGPAEPALGAELPRIDIDAT
ncbi:Sec-independent protein translocase protein TatB [Nocardia nova SH22a]|uniref:Sec-independent protein translocase protein TatB n=1 Tax=Nocardia nova SH22a TaxID=1415166 RepID=W5TLG3_9NOCA|nr:Sec-independent protein translocase protein TatB [Nocardia nova SH22a]